MIFFNLPTKTGTEANHIARALDKASLTAGAYHAACREWLQAKFGRRGVFLTPSCTHALEMAAILLELKPGDEIIMPSFTFVSTANAFAMHGATPVFVDIREDTLNIDERLIEAAITPRTRAIVVVHYAGVACDMGVIAAIAKRHGVPIIEDAAHALLAQWKGQALGTIGSMATFSFHETKNITAGEGGCLVLNDETYAVRADVLQHKGTNRSAFQRGETNKYSWVDIGSSWVLGELNAAYLFGNLEAADSITAARVALWERYYNALLPLQDKGLLTLPFVPDECTLNGHIFYLKLRDKAQRDDFIALMRAKGVETTFHYVPLHSAPAGLKYGRFSGEDRFTTRESERLVRLPLYYNLSATQADTVIAAAHDYFKQP